MMKKLLSLTLVLFIALPACALGQGLFPPYTDLFGVEMPSLTAVLLREADTVSENEDGSRTVFFSNVSEDDFDAFSEYMDTKGCALSDYSIEGSVFSATIEKQGANFSFVYDMSSLSCSITYSSGTREEDEEALLRKRRKAGDVVTFGSYEQDNNMDNGKEPIEWIVLSVNEDGSFVLLSKYALDCERYNSSYTNFTWETCTLRNWLNEDFYCEAFSVQEQAKIVPAVLENGDNPKYGTTGGNDTTDKVWLLSIDEVTDEYGEDQVYGCFMDDASRMCAPTEYAVAKGASQSNSYAVDGVGACWWWLRSPGNVSWIAADVSRAGFVSISGNLVNRGDRSVRPVVVVLP